MSKKELIVGLLAILGLFCGIMLPHSLEAQEFIIGVTYIGDPVSTSKQWQLVGNYLAKLLNTSVKVTPLDFTATVQWVEAGKVNMVVTNPLIYYLLKDKAQLVPLVVVVQKVRNEPVDKYGSVIFVKSEGQLKGIPDLKGKVIGIASKNSLGGGIGGLALLEQEGIKIESITIKELKTQDKVVFAVLNGAVDAGIVRTGVLESMAEKNEIDIKKLRILHRAEDSFPFVHSTVLWPEWIVAVRSDVQSSTREQIKRSLQSLNPQDDTLASSGLYGFKDAGEALSSSVSFFDLVIKTYNKLK